MPSPQEAQVETLRPRKKSDAQPTLRKIRRGRNHQRRARGQATLGRINDDVDAWELENQLVKDPYLDIKDLDHQVQAHK